MASDGLFDNLTNSMILECLTPSLAKDFADVQGMSECIAVKAEKYSMDKNWDSPFAVNARA
jgi:hypothetical protein